MIKIQFMKPFYTKISQGTLRLVFAYQYFSIIKDEEAYHFIPIEGKEMLIDLETQQVKNVSEIFVFQRSNRFIRLPLYQLLLVSNIHEFLTPVIEESMKKAGLSLDKKANGETSLEATIEKEVLLLIEALEKQNIERLIDQALKEKNEDMFYKLLQTKESN